MSGTKYGASTTVVYDTAADYLAEHGRRYDSTEGVAWTAYRRQNCTSTYGCVTSWRQLYFDDAAALAGQVRPRQPLRPPRRRDLGAGLRRDAARAVEGDRRQVRADTTPPKAGIRNVGRCSSTPRSRSRGPAPTTSGIASYDVQVSIDGGGWNAWLTKTTRGRRCTGARRPRLRVPRPGPRPARATSAPGPRPRRGLRRRSSRAAASGASWPTACRCAARVDTSAKVGDLNSGDIVAITGGPTSAGGYTGTM